MGNRAVISVKDSSVGIYLHWNGGRESVQGFLRAAKDLGVRSPGSDETYFLARLAQVIGNFFGGTTSVGVGSLDKLDTDNGDNGHFIIGPNFEILEQRHYTGHSRASLASLKEYEDGVYRETMKANATVFSLRI